MSQSVVICGYYGFENLGDEVILSVLVRRVRAEQPDATITVLAGNTAAIRRDHGVDAVHWQDIGAVRRAIFGADHVIVGGGGLFEDIFSTPLTTLNTRRHGGLTYYGGVALLAQGAGVATTIESVGVGPLETDEGRQLAATVFSGADAVRVRDPASQTLATMLAPDARIELALDPAWELEPFPTEVGDQILLDEGITERLAITEDRRPLAVCLRPWPGFSPERLIEALSLFGGGGGRPLVFVPFSRDPRATDSDLHLAMEVAADLPNAAVLAGRYSGPEVASVLGACDATVAMRLHASILSLRAGTPALGLAYHPKVSGLYGVSGGYASLPLSASASEVVTALESLSGKVPEGDFQNAQQTSLLSRSDAPDRAHRGGSQLLLAAMQDQAAALSEELTEAKQAAESADSERQRLVGKLRSELESERKKRRGAEARLDRLESGRGMRGLRALWKARRRAQTAIETVRGRASRGGGATVVKPASVPPAEVTPSGAATEDSDSALDLATLESLRERVAPGADVFALAPSIRWDAVLFQRPQQLALAVGRLGFPTVYCMKATRHSVRTVAPNVHVLAGPDGGRAVLAELVPFAVLTLPYNYFWSQELGDTIRILDHIDDLEVFQSFKRDELAAEFETGLEEADVVSCTAQALVEQIVDRRPDAVLCPNGVSVVHFAPDPARSRPDDFPVSDDGQIIVGFFGAMARWMDWSFVDEVAAQMEHDATFVFIGPDYDKTMHDVAGLWDRPNVYWIGPRDHGDLPAYLDQFDVSIVPFQLNNVTHAVSPLKLFEYLAGECPVVATPIREALRYPEVRTAGTAAEFAAAIRSAAEDRKDPSARAGLRRRALANSWDVRAVSLVEQALRVRATSQAQ